MLANYLKARVLYDAWKFEIRSPGIHALTGITVFSAYYWIPWSDRRWEDTKLARELRKHSAR